MAQLDGLIDIVRDANNGLFQLGLDIDQFILQAGAGDGVYCAEGLVHQDHRRIRR